MSTNEKFLSVQQLRAVKSVTFMMKSFISEQHSYGCKHRLALFTIAVQFMRCMCFSDLEQRHVLCIKIFMISRIRETKHEN